MKLCALQAKFYEVRLKLRKYLPVREVKFLKFSSSFVRFRSVKTTDWSSEGADLVRILLDQRPFSSFQKASRAPLASQSQKQGNSERTYKRVVEQGPLLSREVLLSRTTCPSFCHTGKTVTEL